MADKIQKSIEFKAAKAISEIDRLLVRLQRTSDMLKRVEQTANGISFQKFIPAIDSFVKSFSKLDALPKNIENIRVMAQALNRFKMVSVELNKADFSVSFAKITRGIYSFMDSMNRMENLQKGITAIAELGRGINRLTNSSIKLQNTKVSFSSLTQAIYKFVGSILRIKDLDVATDKIERLANLVEKLRKNMKTVSVDKLSKNIKETSKSVKDLTSGFSLLGGNAKRYYKFIKYFRKFNNIII